MKAKYILLLVLIFSGIFSLEAYGKRIQKGDKWYYIGEIIGNDTLFYALDREFYYGVENNLLLKVSSGTIHKVTVSNGSVKKINDSTYSIKTYRLDSTSVKVFSKNDFKFKIQSRLIPDPEIQIKGLSGNALAYEDINEETEFIAFTKDSFNFKIIGFRICYVDNRGFETCAKSNSNKFSEKQLKRFKFLINAKWERKKFLLEDFVVMGPDSITRKIGKAILCRLYAKKIDAFAANYWKRLPLQSNLRIKVKGTPTLEDSKTINFIISELNEITETIEVKKVQYFPSLTIVFDSSKTEEILKMGKPLRFFPYLKKPWFIVYPLKANQYERKLQLWGNILLNYANLHDDREKLDLTEKEKNELKLIYSKEGHKKIRKSYKKKHYSNANFTKIMLLSLLSFIFILILTEVNNTYKLFSGVKSKFFRYVISYLLVSQLVVVLSFIFFGFERIDIERFVIPFSLLCGMFIYVSDNITNKIVAAWKILISELFLSTIAVTFSYYLVYFFTRGELLKLSIINESILLILISFLLVKILIRYQIIKVGHAVREKDIKLSKQNELLVKTQLNAIQARINPHFLYNSLNSLAELSKIDADKTENMALSLSKLFQYNLNKNETMLIQLSEEIKMVSLYLSIEQQRFSDKMEFQINVDETLNDFNLPKFLLQPLVENAVKHGISKMSEKGIIKVDISEANKKVNIKIFDNGSDFSDGFVNGYGLQNTYEKLDLIFQKPYEIRFVNGKNKHIWLQLNK